MTKNLTEKGIHALGKLLNHIRVAIDVCKRPAIEHFFQSEIIPKKGLRYEIRTLLGAKSQRASACCTSFHAARFFSAKRSLAISLARLCMVGTLLDKGTVGCLFKLVLLEVVQQIQPVIGQFGLLTLTLFGEVSTICADY